MELLRVATFNVKHGAYQDSYRGHAKQMAEACASLEADILALQEVDKGVVRSGFYNMARLAAKASGMVPFFALTMKYRVGEYGNALLVRGELRNPYVLPLKGGPRFRLKPFDRPVQFGYEPRNALFASAIVKNRVIQVTATHLSTQKALRNAQLLEIVRSMPYVSEPAIMLGDLNMVHDEAMPHFAEAHMELIQGPPTYPADNPKRAIDHIAVRGLALATVDTVQLPVSDHRAFIAELS